jgi:outer membrane protein assembly factor BamA
LRELDLPFVDIKYNNYVYIMPSKVSNISKDSAKLNAILKKYGYSYSNLEKYFSPQENRYVKIISNVNPTIAQKVKDLKSDYYNERTGAQKIPILHGL